MSLPTDSAARKRIPMFSGLLAYFPDALAAVAEHSFVSNEKYNPGEPLHWSREKSSDHLDCCVRHLTDIATGADKIEELKALTWRALAELQLTLEAQSGKSNDGWIEWTGGTKAPLPIENWNTVDVKLRDGHVLHDYLVDELYWNHYGCNSDIVAYRPPK